MKNMRALIFAAGLGCVLAATAVRGAPQEQVKPTGGELMKDADGAGPKKFLPATKEEGEKAIAFFKKFAGEVEEQLKVKFGTIESPHFLIFTDWDTREYDFLKTNVEQAYSLVSRQFDIPVSQNVFIGKLPVFMIASQDDFKRFAREIDQSDAADNLAGYYMGNTKGFGHMVMWKPDLKKSNGNVHDAEKRWAYVLTHEFTHAFVARYRSNGFVPHWVNEGLAEVVADHQFPKSYTYAWARDREKKRKSLSDLFEDKGMLPADDYAVAQTMVETMLKENPKTFLKYFNDMKDGMKPDEALLKEYKVDRKGLEAAWRKYVTSTK